MNADFCIKALMMIKTEESAKDQLDWRRNIPAAQGVGRKSQKEATLCVAQIQEELHTAALLVALGALVTDLFISDAAADANSFYSQLTLES